MSARVEVGETPSKSEDKRNFLVIIQKSRNFLIGVFALPTLVHNKTPNASTMFSASSNRNNGKGPPYSSIHDYSDSDSDDGQDDFIQAEIRQQRVSLSLFCLRGYRVCINLQCWC